MVAAIFVSAFLDLSVWSKDKTLILLHNSGHSEPSATGNIFIVHNRSTAPYVCTFALEKATTNGWFDDAHEEKSKRSVLVNALNKVKIKTMWISLRCGSKLIQSEPSYSENRLTFFTKPCVVLKKSIIIANHLNHDNNLLCSSFGWWDVFL